MSRLVLMTQLLTMALPGCKSPEARRAEVLVEVDDAMRRGQHTLALRTIDRATEQTPGCLEFWLRSLDLRISLQHCEGARRLLPAVAASEEIRLLQARVALTCDGDVKALSRAWKHGYGRHPDLLHAIQRYRPDGWHDAHAFTKVLIAVRDEKDPRTLNAWLAAMAEPNWYLERFLDVAGLLPAMHRVRDPQK